MNGCARRRNALRFTCLAILTCCMTAGVAMAGNEISRGYELSLANPTAQQEIGADVRHPESQKFVEIEVTQVNNPQRLPLSFEVQFQPARGEKVRLGTFSLFPPDNPGKFLVATKTQLRAGGTLSVTLVPLRRTDDEEQIRVRLKRLSFRLE